MAFSKYDLLMHRAWASRTTLSPTSRPTYRTGLLVGD